MAAFTPSDDSVRMLASRNISVAQRAMTALTGKKMSEILNVAESTVSAFRKDDLDRAMYVLAAAGLKVVPSSEITKSPDEMRHLLKTARRHYERELEELGNTIPGDL